MNETSKTEPVIAGLTRNRVPEAHHYDTRMQGSTHNERGEDRKIAFTLAEVLITLGIIGIVAAMTMPTLIQKHQEKVTVTKLKKFYSIMSQSYTFALSKYGTPDLWGFGGRDKEEDVEDDSYTASGTVKMRDILFEQVKFLKKCDRASKSHDCNYPFTLYYASGSVASDDRGKMSAISFADGSSAAFLVTSSDCSNKRGKGKFLSNDCGWIYYDVNGLKGPNTYGQDIFPFYLTKYGVIPTGTSDEYGEVYSSPFYRDTGCGRTAWVIYNENMDYLHCDDLSWDGKKKCK